MPNSEHIYLMQEMRKIIEEIKNKPSDNNSIINEDKSDRTIMAKN